jgi:nicotinate-nucleotide pyrophosphorylase
MNNSEYSKSIRDATDRGNRVIASVRLEREMLTEARNRGRTAVVELADEVITKMEVKNKTECWFYNDDDRFNRVDYLVSQVTDAGMLEHLERIGITYLREECNLRALFAHYFKLWRADK